MTRILLIEDEERIARFVELELTHEGYEVEKAYDGRAGLALAESGRHDLVLLENQGKVSGSETYSTKTESTAYENRNRHAETAARVGRRIASGINRANRYTVAFSRKGEMLFELPLLVPVLLLIFGFWVVVPLLIVGLFFGFKYELKGAAGVEAVNRVMDKASEVADNIVSEVRKEAGKGEE